MRLRASIHKVALVASIVTAVNGYSRGGETGTLDEGDERTTSVTGMSVASSGSRPPLFLGQEHFRRLRARLSLRPLAAVPGWESHRAWRSHDRYFTVDDAYEILPLMTDILR